MTPIHRQWQCRLLLTLEPLVSRWSLRLARGDAERAVVLRRYLVRVAAIHVGLMSEVRRGWVASREVLLVVDEYAETLNTVRRPRLSEATERQIRRDMAAELRTCDPLLLNGE